MGTYKYISKNIVPLLRSTTLEISDCGKKTVVSFPAVVWAHQATRSLCQGDSENKGSFVTGVLIAF